MGPIFRTISVPANEPALYQLSIRAPQQAFSELATFTFPISPSSIRYEPTSLSSYSETQGPSVTQGVTRVVDTYGLSPPTIVLEGTTGWDRHLSDGYILTGLQSMQLLQRFLARYAELNQIRRQAGNPYLYALEFYDYFTQQFWQVEPIGPQVVRQSADRPILAYYRLRWAAVKTVGLPILGTVDAIANTLLTPAQQAGINAARSLGALLVAYGPSSIAGALP